MPSRVYVVPVIVLLFCAFILSLLVAISLPNLPMLDIVRCHFTEGTAPRVSTGPESIKEIRVNHLSSSSTTMLILLLHFVPVGSLVFGEKTSVTHLPIKLTRGLGQGLLHL